MHPLESEGLSLTLKATPSAHDVKFSMMRTQYPSSHLRSLFHQIPESPSIRSASLATYLLCHYSHRLRMGESLESKATHFTQELPIHSQGRQRRYSASPLWCRRKSRFSRGVYTRSKAVRLPLWEGACVSDKVKNIPSSEQNGRCGPSEDGRERGGG